MDRGDDELDLLLSGGRLRGPVAERERERVLDAVQRRRPLWRRLNVVVPTFVVAAAASLFLVARPASDSGEAGRRYKGAAGAAVHELTCSGGTAAACPRGSRVSIAARGQARGGYVGAYAEPEGGGERIWYFSTEDGSAVVPAQGADPRLASRSVVLGPEHRTGTYRVIVRVSDHPLGRAELLAAGPATTLRLQVVDR
jgi:hypothetical protein